MSRAYSIDLRERVVAAVETGGLSCHRAAAQFGVGVSTAIRWVERPRKTGSVTLGQIGGYRPRAIAGEHHTWLLARIKERDFTLRGLVAELAERGLKVDYRSVWTFVHEENLNFKKSLVTGERDRPDVARQRGQGLEYQDRVDPARLVFIDETWTRTNMAPLRGWASRGSRLIAADYPDSITAAAVAVAVQESGMVKSHQTLLLTVEDMDAALKKHVDYRAPGSGQAGTHPTSSKGNL